MLPTSSSLGCLLLMFALTNATPLWLRPESKYNGIRAEADYRLPTMLQPVHYKVVLLPFFQDLPDPDRAFTFDGTVEITMTATEATNWIRLHSYDINIENKDKIQVVDANGAPVPVYNFTLSGDDRNFLDIYLDSVTLTANSQYTLTISYIGNLNTDLEGFYRSSYTDSSSVTKWMGVTQFEQTGARRAFPCFDEPGMKATFTISIAHSSTNNVLSNMPMVSDEAIPPGDIYDLQNWKMSVFEESAHPMSTYLVAFTVSEFQSIEHAEDNRYKVWARPGSQNQGEIANNLSPKIVDFMEGYTGHSYSFPKIDQIAIPDFAAGAMENWGLITYRESRLLYQEGVTTSRDRQLIETVVSHELAHQWFGNLVSPTWWSHIWLNEGFATYFEYHALDSIQDLWQLQQQFIIEQLHTVLQTDALSSTHPLLTVVDTPASSSAAFDNIAYNKGGCIVRFLVHLMGLENFKSAIKDYLTLQEFGNAEPANLWASLQKFVDTNTLPASTDVATVMTTWNDQAGYPVVKITRDYSALEPTVNITQERFLFLKDDNTTYTERWWVPLTMTSRNNSDFETAEIFDWFFDDKVAYKLPKSEITNDDWILFNVQQYAYYRVHYDVQNWKKLSAALVNETRKFHVINRAQLLDDSQALARANLLSYDIALDVTGYLDQETEFAPWAAAIASTDYLDDRLSTDSSSRDLFAWYMLSKLSNMYEVVNGLTETEDDSHMLRIKRNVIIESACELGHKDCNAEAISIFRDWRDNDVPVSPDLKSTVYCAGMRNGGQAEYDFLFKKYVEAESSAAEQDLILMGLACASNKTLLQNLLDESIADPSQIRSQNARRVHSWVYGNYQGVDTALDFIIKNWKRCQIVYSGPYNVARAFNGNADKCNTEDQRKKIEDLLNSEEAAEMDAVIIQSLIDSITTINQNLDWQDKHRDTVLSYLRKKQDESGSMNITGAPLLILSLLFTILAINK